ncbi:MAG TPA: hypothetical protein VJ788_01350 [Gemmatimonadota bacterium]|nr:hypothetical protein [Gemmatimonadota bacterium]
MTCRPWLWMLVLAVGAAACSDDGGPAGLEEKELAFTVSAPSTIPTKQVVDLQAQVTRATRVDYPLTVTFEEANQNQTFAPVATLLLRKPEDTIAAISEDAARDPLYRVTICEAGQAARLCVERTVQVDVLDFP